MTLGQRAVPVLLVAFLTLAVLYAPQPLLPRFAQTFSVTETRAALLIAIALLPLSIAPLSFGALLRRLDAVRVLRGAVLVLGVLVAVQGVVPSFAGLLGVRLLQGVAIAAILTALMTYVGAVAQGHAMQRLMAWYVAATILGGMLGRLLAGVVATWLSPAAFFGMLGGAVMLSTVLFMRTPPTASSGAAAKSARTMRFTDVLGTTRYVRVYALVFCLFFAFSALMNFLPFRLHAVRPTASEALTGLLYSGYVVGIAGALGAQRIVRRLGSVPRTVMAGTALGFVALGTAAVPSVVGMMAAVVLICAALFVVHTVAASWINESAGAQRGLVNGLYVAFYYAGGVLGAYVPGFAYERGGWGAFLLVLGLILLGAQASAVWWWMGDRARTGVHR